MGMFAASTQHQSISEDWINVPPVFIVGCRGSGTTLLKLVLSAHPGISTSREIAQVNDDSNEVPRLESLFPDCKFILVVRDPRDVFAWGKDKFGWDFLTFRNEWERSVVHSLATKSFVGPARAIQVKYEDLIMTPQNELQKICRFLNLEYVDELLTELQREPSVSGSHRGSPVLTQEEYDGICRRLHSPMKLLGYLSYKEYDHYSRSQLREIATRRSEALKSLSVDRAARPQPNRPVEMASPHWIEVPPIFIVGHGRSGTTLLRMMLSAHPEIFISSEGAYICPLRSQISAYGDVRERRNLAKLHKDLFPWLEAVNFLNPPRVQNLIEWVDRFGGDERSLITFYGTWEARTLGRHDLAWWGDNEPSHLFNIPYLQRLFPSSRFILMIRDPRDVYASFKTAWPDTRTAESIAMLWERCLLDGLLAASRLGSGVVHQVRYEDLVTNPEAQLKEVCKFLNVEYTDAMMNFHESDAAKNLSQVEHHRNIAQPLFRSSVGRYRQILTREEIATIHHRLYSPMTFLGYLSYEHYEEISRDKIG
jgi:Sulfotransferase family